MSDFIKKQCSTCRYHDGEHASFGHTNWHPACRECLQNSHWEYGGESVGIDVTIKAIEHLMNHGCSRITSCLDCPAHKVLKSDPSMCRLLRKIPETGEVVNGCYNCKHEGYDLKCSTCELGNTKLTQYRKISNWEPKQ